MKSQNLIVTFHTTTEAMAWEKVCKAENLPGRLIPVPPTVKAGCGFAWLAPLDAKGLLLEGAANFNLNYEQLHENLT